MRAVVFEEFGGPVAVQEVPDPVPPIDGVVVEVAASGLCRSDWHGWVGHDDTVRLPHVPGHELSGRVAAVGAGVRRWKPGDRVTVPFVCGCGRCHWCRSGQAQVCPDQTQPGFTHWGSFAQYVALHAADVNLVEVPDAVSDEAAAALGCRFATAYRALHGRARVQSGEWVTVIGAGGVGLSAVMIAVAAGARVLAVDRNASSLELASALGANQTLAAESDDLDLPARVHELTNGGSDITIDAVGSAATASDAIHSLRRRGRHVQVGLLPRDPRGHPRIPMDRVIAWELDLLGTHGMAAVDYSDLLALIEAGILQPQLLIDRVADLDQAARELPEPRGRLAYRNDHGASAVTKGPNGGASTWEQVSANE